jgi:hypothetical protein
MSLFKQTNLLQEMVEGKEIHFHDAQNDTDGAGDATLS